MNEPNPAPSPPKAVPSDREAATPTAPDWRSVVERFQRSNALRASWQIADSVGGHLLLWVLIYWSLTVSWWLTIPLAALAGGFLVRVFIIFHDCGHRSFFESRTANAFWGWVTGVLTMMPYPHWRGDHAIHHGTTGDLDRRGVGDVWTLTVREYIAAPRWKRLAYRLARSPFVMFLVAPLVMMTVLQRFPRKGAGHRERRSVWITNGVVALMVFGMVMLFGLVPYVVIQLVIHLVAGSFGVWLFYVQHQYEDAYWEPAETWDYTTAALKGSSYLRLPRVLQWFSGNIGFHHVHHLSPRIPNYYLEACHRSDPLFANVPPIGMLHGLQTLGLRLWDETSRKLVGWGHLEQVRGRARG